MTVSKALRLSTDTEYCYLVNEEPGVMMPGDCFTIEVRTLSFVQWVVPFLTATHLILAVHRERVKSRLLCIS